MAKLYQIIVPDENLISRIINSGNQVHELMVIERSDKKFVAEHSKELEKPALYILVNRDNKKLYVGETDDSIKRLKNHAAKDFWTEAIVFHSTTETLSTTEVKWLEAKAYKTIADLGYYDLSENIQKPQFPKLKKYQELDLEPIFQEAKGYICAAGFDFFMKEENMEQPLLFFQEMKSANAKCRMEFFPQSKRYVIKAGSHILGKTWDSCKGSIATLRAEVLKNKKISKKDGDNYILLKDVEMPADSSSPSGASRFFRGASRPGTTDWTDEKGRKYPSEWWKNPE